MQKSCIADSSALVALLDPREEHHRWARETFSRQPEPWFTCDAVVSEAFFLLQGPSTRALDQLLRHGHLRLAFNLSNELPEVLDLRTKYGDVPMSLADACLVRMNTARSGGVDHRRRFQNLPPPQQAGCPLPLALK